MIFFVKLTRFVVNVIRNTCELKNFCKWSIALGFSCVDTEASTAAYTDLHGVTI